MDLWGAGGCSVLERAGGLRRTYRLLHRIINRRQDSVNCHASATHMWHQALLGLKNSSPALQSDILWNKNAGAYSCHIWSYLAVIYIELTFAIRIPLLSSPAVLPHGQSYLACMLTCAPEILPPHLPLELLTVLVVVQHTLNQCFAHKFLPNLCNTMLDQSIRQLLMPHWLC